MTRRPWESFLNVRSQTGPHGARDVHPDELVDMRQYRREERRRACGGHDPLRTLLAYAQDELAYDGHDRLVKMDTAACRALPRERRLNKFGLAYRRDATFYLNRILADIVVGAAVRLCQTQRWDTVLYDGLRTVDGAFRLYHFATDQDLANGLLALPGQSAHNKGMAVDSMMEDETGSEIDMGGHFDHLDMETNSRAYTGNKISDATKKNRLVREAAFIYSAFTQNLLISPLRSEFWDDRPPEDRTDLWRVLDSAARCLGIRLITEEDEQLRKRDREAFRSKWERWNYADFLARWQDTFKGREQEAEALFGSATPPPEERPEFYHGNFHPIYDADLKASGKNLTE